MNAALVKVFYQGVVSFVKEGLFNLDHPLEKGSEEEREKISPISRVLDAFPEKNRSVDTQVSDLESFSGLPLCLFFFFFGGPR